MNMEYIIVSAAVIAWLIAAGQLTIKAIDTDSWISPWTIIALIFWVMSFGYALHLIDDASQKGPCLKYEHSLMYNPAIKQMMPIRICVQRGEWIEQP